MFLIHYWLQIKQNVYSLGTFHAPVATQFKVNVYRNPQKASCLTVFYSSISQHFPNAKALVVRAVVAEYISRKRNWQQIVNLSKYDRK